MKFTKGLSVRMIFMINSSQSREFSNLEVMAPLISLISALETNDLLIFYSLDINHQNNR